jgi:hypothetical protein
MVVQAADLCGGLGQGEELLGRELRGVTAGGVGEVPSDGL